jgi:hypothetical protein
VTFKIGQKVWVVGNRWDRSTNQWGLPTIVPGPETRRVVSADSETVCLMDSNRDDHIAFYTVSEVYVTDQLAWEAAKVKEEQEKAAKK